MGAIVTLESLLNENPQLSEEQLNDGFNMEMESAYFDFAEDYAERNDCATSYVTDESGNITLEGFVKIKPIKFGIGLSAKQYEDHNAILKNAEKLGLKELIKSSNAQAAKKGFKPVKNVDEMENVLKNGGWWQRNMVFAKPEDKKNRFNGNIFHDILVAYFMGDGGISKSFMSYNGQLVFVSAITTVFAKTDHKSRQDGAPCYIQLIYANENNKLKGVVVGRQKFIGDAYDKAGKA